jgi:hypothetical protein
MSAGQAVKRESHPIGAGATPDGFANIGKIAASACYQAPTGVNRPTPSVEEDRSSVEARTCAFRRIPRNP